MGVVENLIKVFQGCLVQFFWKGLEVHGKSSKENDWKEGVEVLKVVIIRTEVLIKVQGEWMPHRDRRICRAKKVGLLAPVCIML